MSVVAEWNNVTKIYRSGFRTTRALDDFDLQLEKGGTIGVLGEPGSGKTTAIQCLLGTVRPSSGSTRLFGGAPDNSQLRENIGYFPEQFDVFPELPVNEIIRLLGHLRGVESPDEQVEELKQPLGLSSIWTRRLSKCTDGERRRVGILQAVLGHPPLLILDQPTEQLNTDGWDWLCQRVRKRDNQDLTTLLVTHRPEPVKQFCQQTVVVRDGNVVERGPTETIIDQLEGESLDVQQGSYGENDG